MESFCSTTNQFEDAGSSAAPDAVGAWRVVGPYPRALSGKIAFRATSRPCLEDRRSPALSIGIPEGFGPDPRG